MKNIFIKSNLLIFFFILILNTNNIWAQINWSWASSGGAGIEDYSLSIVDGIDFDENDNTYIIGGISSPAQIDTLTLNSFGNTNILIAKYDKYGNVIWAKTAGGKYGGVGRSIKYLDGYLYTCGTFWDTAYFDNHVLIGQSTIFRSTFVAKLDTNGNYIWLKQGTNPLFGYSACPAMAINSDSINNIYYSSFCNANSLLLDTIYTDNFNNITFFIVQLDTSGNINWVHYVESKPGGWCGQGVDMQIDNNNNVVYATSNARRDTSVVNTSIDYSNMLIGKLNSLGDVLWEYEIGDTTLSIWHGLPCAMSIDSNDNIYTCGHFINSFYIDTSNHDPGGSFVAKFNGQDGNIIYSKVFENLGFSNCDYDHYGNVIYSGTFSDSLEVGGITIYPYSPSSSCNMFVFSYDTSGTFNWVVSYGDYGDERIISSAANKNMYAIAGNFGDSLILGPYTLMSDTFNTNSSYFFVATQVKPEDTGIISIPNSDLSFKIYPNPTNSRIILESSNDLSQFTIEIYSFGSKLIKKIDQTNSNIIDVSNLKPGTYFISLKNKEIRVVKRFIKI